MIKQKQIAETRRGEWRSSQEFLTVSRDLAADDSMHEALYDGLRSKVIHLFRSGASIEQVIDWRDAIIRMRSLIESEGVSNGLPLVSTRLEVLQDLNTDFIAQLNMFKPADLKNQPHFHKCLKLLESVHGKMARRELIKKLGLKEANGTRVLKILESERLISRERSGSAITVHLSPEGRKAIMDWESPPARTPRPTTVAKLTMQPIPGARSASYPVSRQIENVG